MSRSRFDVLERYAPLFEAPEPSFREFLHRRERKERNRRIGTAALALAVAAAGIGGLARAFSSDPETRPAEQLRNPFLGEWASADDSGFDETSQTMTIRAGEDGVFRVTVHDEASFDCSRPYGEPPNQRFTHLPKTLTGTGRLKDPTTLVVPSPVLTCADGEDPRTSPLDDAGGSYTLVLDPATDRLYDNLGWVWNRGAPPEHLAGRSTEEGVDGPGTYSMLHREVTFRAADPWTDHIEAYIDPRLFFLIGPGDASITILVNALPPDPCDTLRDPPAAEELVQAIRSNPDLEATAPVTERVGRIDALRMDVVAAPGASIGPCSASSVDVVYVPGRPWGGVEPGSLGRIYVLDLPGGSARTLAIWITASEANFDRAVRTAAPVLDSFEFHAE
jgi:hypothetical protein